MNKRNIYFVLLALVVIVIAVVIFTLLTKSTRDEGTPKGTNIEDKPATLQVEPNKDTTSPNTVSGTNKKTTLLPRSSSSSTKASSTPPSGTPPPRPDSHAGLTFEEAMKLFGNFGYRYQFVACRGMPGGFIMKQGVNFMLDNRDPNQHTFALSSQTHIIPGYDFVITKLFDIGKHMITCDGGGAAEITIVQ